MSQKFLQKFIENTFKELPEDNWIQVIMWWLIDSKYRTKKRLDYFLREQIENPEPLLVEVAKELRKKSKTPDTLMINILKYVYGLVVYETDQKNFGYAEKWAQAIDVWSSRKDDCDGLNSLVYVLARLAGISNIVLYSVVGDTGSGPHYWTIYYSAKTEKWYAFDATYRVNLYPISEHREQFRLQNNKYESIWFIFNDEIILKQRS